MTDILIFKEAIRIAKERGYVTPNGPVGSGDYCIIFSNSFAKAFWGENREFFTSNVWHNIKGKAVWGTHNSSEISWKHHLRMMVVLDNPIDYLRKFVNTEKQKL